jgi:hypothetical protein
MDEDNTLYELMNVTRTATDTELKKVSIEEHAVMKSSRQVLPADFTELSLAFSELS